MLLFGDHRCQIAYRKSNVTFNLSGSFHNPIWAEQPFNSQFIGCNILRVCVFVCVHITQMDNKKKPIYQYTEANRGIFVHFLQGFPGPRGEKGDVGEKGEKVTLTLLTVV